MLKFLIVSPKEKKFNGESEIYLKAQAIDSSIKRARTLESVRLRKEIDIIVDSHKTGIRRINLVLDGTGNSIHMVNAVSSSRAVIKDVNRFEEYPDMIIRNKDFNLEAILKRFRTFIFLKFQIQDSKINAYQNKKSFKDKKPSGVLDPKVGKLQTY